VTWGEPDMDSVLRLLRKRSELVGGARLTEEELTERSSFETLDLFAEALCAGTADLTDVKGLKPVFRLHPPRGGFRGSRKSAFGAGGELGYRGKAITPLVSRMS